MHDTQYYLLNSVVLDWRLLQNGFDQEMIPILKKLWKDGIRTICSCAGHEGAWWEAYLTFKAHDRFFEFLIKSRIRIQRLIDGDYGVYSWERDDIFSSAPKDKDAKDMRDKFMNVLSEYSKFNALTPMGE